MGNDESVEILKGAILLEKRGKAFYESVAKGSKSGAVREIFEIMAGEETKHIKMLLKLHSELLESGEFSPATHIISSHLSYLRWLHYQNKI